MGNFFAKKYEEPIMSTIVNTINDNYEFNVKEIVQQYEYIKNTKHIEDLDKLIAVMKNTDWDKIKQTDIYVQPSAPYLQREIPITTAHIIEPDKFTK